MNLIPINKLSDDSEFYQGTRIRKYRSRPKDADDLKDFFEYMLVDYDDKEYMMVVNISSANGSYHAGSVYSYVNKLQEVLRHVVTGKALKEKLNEPETYILVE